MLAWLLPRLPYEVINIILSYSEDGLVRSEYHLSSGALIHRIQWDCDILYDLEAMILVRRIFPAYWHHHADPDEKHIYFFIKEYFKKAIQQRGGWNESLIVV